LILALAGVHSLSPAGAKPFVDRVLNIVIYLYSTRLSDGKLPRV
jgi:hypothetical protein